MRSIWNSQSAPVVSSPSASNSLASSPGGGAATKFQSVLQSPGRQAPRAAGASVPLDSTGGTGGTGGSSGASGSSSSSGSDTTISANDFLTLLVTEMQNQDPTADTDPNEYINQLVQINSLEQLISINQNLSTVLGAASSSATGDSAGAGVGATGNAAKDAMPADAGVRHGTSPAANGVRARPTAASAVEAVRTASRPEAAPGNLGVPGDAPAAHQVARALDGRAARAGHGHAIRDIPTRSLP